MKDAPGTRPVAAPAAAHPAVAILLATYNGAAVLPEQLASYRAQTLRPALVLVGDDGSQDGTQEVLDAFAAAHPDLPVQRVAGPGRGPAANFRALFARVPAGIDLAAISDQDDVWLPEKLARAAAALAAVPDGEPALYGAATVICDAALAPRGVSRRLRCPTGFRHALVQNFAGGNTMVLNRAALDLVRAAAAEAPVPVLHDWWLYQIVAGAGGRILYDPEPVLLYRQHAGNLIGANTGLAAQLRRLRMMLAGDFRRWNAENIAALAASAHRLTPENRALLAGFAALRDRALPGRLAMLWRLGLYRQDLAGRLSLWLAALLGRI